MADRPAMPDAEIPLPRPAECWSLLDPRYPEAVRALSRPPAELWVAGQLPSGPAVAIVGTRSASPPALELAHDLAAELACHGVTIVSGGARGIDTAAHRGALTVSGITLAVLASGLRNAYPAENASLFGQISEAGGCLVSPAPPTARPIRGRFLGRNRLIAALADCVVVVQAPARSGAMSTAHWAKRLKRQLFSVPGDVWDPRFVGSNRLLADGAAICTSARDVLSVRPSLSARRPKATSEAVSISNEIQGLDACCGAVLEQLRAGVRNPDRIAVELDIRINRVHECLLSLELYGFAHRKLDGTFGLKPRAQ